MCYVSSKTQTSSHIHQISHFLTDLDIVQMFSPMSLKGQTSSAGLQDRLVGLGQHFVADLGVGDGPVFLAQVQTQLTLVAEV